MVVRVATDWSVEQPRQYLGYRARVRILAVCGSLQARSSNLDLLRSAVTVAPEGVEVVIFDGVRDLPLFNPDIEAGGSVPSSVGTWRKGPRRERRRAHRHARVRSLAAGRKNAIDWVIGQPRRARQERS
jgi:chromate reductase, NAD(P)H dehydrogenase (quinone)